MGRGSVFGKLYSGRVPSHRSGAIFNSHSYPTKINVAPVLSHILAHTEPGDRVLDGFSGSGTTGLAAALAGSPTDDLKEFVEGLGIDAKWGKREGMLCDISTLSHFISSTMLSSVDPERFKTKAEALIIHLEDAVGWMYKAMDPDGDEGDIRYCLLSEILECPRCKKTISFFKNQISFDVMSIKESFVCGQCGFSAKSSKVPRIKTTFNDKILKRKITTRKREYVCVYGKTGTKTWRRLIDSKDMKILKKVERIRMPASVPIVRMLNRKTDKWGELHRKGYHFYTRRNLVSLGCAWDFANAISETKIRNALKLLISSYNAPHSTLMTRVVCKKGVKHFVPTIGQPSILYLSSLPVEKNIISGLKGKIKKFHDSFVILKRSGSRVRSMRASCTKMPVKNESVDYVFTDPPFGDNIQYSEVNFISEAWLGKMTDSTHEAVVSKFNNKGFDEYKDLLRRSFSEYNRVLKKGKYLTLVFHNSKKDVWRAVSDSWRESGFEFVRASTLEKTQGSFKQVTTSFFVKGDCLILLRKPIGRGAGPDRFEKSDYWSLVGSIIKNAKGSISRQDIFNELMKRHLKCKMSEVLDADKFYEELGVRFPRFRVQ